MWLGKGGGRGTRNRGTWGGDDFVIRVRFGQEHRMIGMAPCPAGATHGGRPEAHDGLVGRRADGSWTNDGMRFRHGFPSLGHRGRQVPYPLPACINAVTPEGWSS